MKKETFLQILERLKAEKAHEAAAASLSKLIQDKEVTHVDLSKLGLSDSLDTKEEQEAATDVIREVLSTPATQSDSSSNRIDKTGVARDVPLNAKQAEFDDTVQTGADVVLVGAAGTGKTTGVRKVTRRLIDSGRVGTIKESTKWLKAGHPGAAILSYTRKAVNNIRHAVVDELKDHTLTVHKILEFQPIFSTLIDPFTSIERNTMSFEPTRNAEHPLPRSLKFIGFEESSMIPVVLYEQLQEAVPHHHQEIFLGDIQQLPPVFGAGILGFKMLELPVIELTEVFRQAKDSPVLALAWKVLEGNPHAFAPTAETYTTKNSRGEDVKRKRWPVLEAYNEVKFDSETGEYLGTVKFQPWQKPLEDYQAMMTIIAQFKAWEREGYYQPDTDVILCPYNKAMGNDELNKGIQQYLGEKRGAVVHEVIAGFQKHYLAEGDRVLYDKEDAFITKISRNINYMGTTPAPASANLDRWGTYRDKLSETELLEAKASSELTEDALEDFLEVAASSVEDRVQDASHDVVIRYAYSDEEVCLSKAAEINNLLGGNAMTIYKFQGSEAERVFLILHHTHAKMVSRELLYTAITRARKFLHIVCEPKSFFTGVASQRIKGNTIQEKAQQFTGLKEKRDQDRVSAELALHKAEREAHEAWDERRADAQQEELAKTDVDTTALDNLVAKSAPSMDAWYFDVKLGKMVERKTSNILPDIQSDPAEELPEPVPYIKPIPKVLSPEETAKLVAERLARIRAKRGA